jgi:hypothetical protein
MFKVINTEQTPTGLVRLILRRADGRSISKDMREMLRTPANVISVRQGPVPSKVIVIAPALFCRRDEAQRLVDYMNELVTA